MADVSPVDVANLALDRLGQPPIVSFDDGNKAANLCGRIYPLARDEIQRRFPWRRLRTRAQIGQEVEKPAWGYQNQFRLPVDLLRLLEVYIDLTPQHRNWELEGDLILINFEGPLNIRYVARQDDPTKWDALMLSAVAAYMAKDMAESLTQDAAKKNFAYTDFNEIMKEAKHANAQEGTPVLLNSPDSWVSVRVGGAAQDARPISEVNP